MAMPLNRKISNKPAYKNSWRSICINRDCKLRGKGCSGFEACPGYKGMEKST